MALTPERIQQLSEPIEEVYRNCVDELLLNIAAHLKGGDAQSTLEWEVSKLAQVGQLRRENLEIIRSLTKDAHKILNGSLGTAIMVALREVEPELATAAAANILAGAPTEPMASQSIINALTNYSRQAVDQLNLVNTVMLDSSLAQYRKLIANTAIYERQLERTQKVLNTKTGEVITGISSRTQALRKAVKQINAAGLTGFKDAGGHNWSVEAYVNMDIRTTVHNVAVQSVFSRNVDYGNSLISVSSHTGARPLCYPYQGKVYSTDGSSGEVEDLHGQVIQYEPLESTSYGLPAGLFGINCGHMPSSFIPGISVVRGEPQDKDANDKAYKLSQQQRKLEREVRYVKREAAMLNAAGDKEGFEKAAAKIQRKQDNLRVFTERSDRTLRLDRLQVAGYDRSVAREVTAINKRRDHKRQEVAMSRFFATKVEADKYYRSWLDSGWSSLYGKEKYAIWEYTHNSNPINKPLSGYQGKWIRDKFVGVRNAQWNYESRWRKIPDVFKQYGTKKGNVSQKNVIKNLTRAIDKYSLPQDMYVRRGSDFYGLAGMLEGSGVSYETALVILQTEDIKIINAAFSNGIYVNHAFTSTGIAADSGFSGNVRYNIFLPRGTHCLYAEPQSAWGNTVGDDQDPESVVPRLYEPGTMPNKAEIGWEAEIIVQRGTAYKIDRIAKSIENGETYFDVFMQVVDQFKFNTGWERTL